MTLLRNALVATRPQTFLRCQMLFSRSMASKDHNPPPVCLETNCGKKPVCGNKSLEHKPVAGKDDFQFYHLLEMPPECCRDPCLNRGFPKFDECLYKESDKAKRKYQVTWVECPPIQIKPKKICCFEKGKRPPIVRRKRKPVLAQCVENLPCPIEGDCPKIASPGCRPVRVPIKCHITRAPANCIKVRAPYPAFSECNRSEPRPRRKVECQCLSVPSLCDVLEYRQSITAGKGPRGNCGSKKIN